MKTNKTGLTKKLAKKVGIAQKDAKIVINTIVEVITNSLKEEKPINATRSTIITKLAESGSFTKKDSKIFLEGFLDVIIESLKDKKGNFELDRLVQITGFGNFSTVIRKGRDFKLPKDKNGNQAEGHTEDRLVVKFKRGSGLKSTETNVFTEGARIQLTGFGTFSVRFKKGTTYSLKAKGELREGVSEDKNVVYFKTSESIYKQK